MAVTSFCLNEKGCQTELNKLARGKRGELMDEFWKRVIYKDPEAMSVCDDYAAVLACNGESDFMMCRKCGKGWIAPCQCKSKKTKNNKLI
jgi:hypothetical protein